MGIFRDKKKSATGRSASQTSSPPHRGRGEVDSAFSNQSPASESQKPPRRVPFARQATSDHISPPAIQEGEIDAFGIQVEDLGRCSENPALFDILVSDIDRNRLTQITMILADRGDYPAMARVMTIADTVDRLIREHVNNAHRQQKLSLSSNSLTDLTLEDVSREADAVYANTTLSKDDLLAKLSIFDRCFSDFQDAPFEDLIQLSEKVDRIRTRVSLQQASPIATSTISEDWETFPQPPLSPAVKTTDLAGGSVVPLPMHNPDSVDEAPLSPAVNSTDHGEVSEVPLPLPVAEPVIIDDQKEVKLAIAISTVEKLRDAWISLIMHRMHVTCNGDRFAISRDLRLMKNAFLRISCSYVGNQRFHTMESQTRSAVIDRCSRAAFKTWRSRFSSEVESLQILEVVGQDFAKQIAVRRLKQSIRDWRLEAKSLFCSRYFEFGRVVRMFEDWDAMTRALLRRRRVEKMNTISVLRAWQDETRGSRQTGAAVDEMFRLRILGPSFESWLKFTSEKRNILFSLEVTQRERLMHNILSSWLENARANIELERDLDIVRAVLAAWREAVTDGENPVSPLHNLGTLSSDIQEVPTTPEAWLEEVPEGESGIGDISHGSLPDSVEHYIIHDSPEIPRIFVDDTPLVPNVLSPELVKQIKSETEDLIVKAQIFLSQRNLSLSPQPLATQPVNRISTAPNLQVSGDESYYQWFERKWQEEEERWRL
jgi:hypothetical protein